MRIRILAVTLIAVGGIAAGLRADDKLSSDDLNKLYERGGASDEFKGQFQPKILPLKPLEVVAATPKKQPKSGKYVASYTPAIYNSTNFTEMVRELQDSRMPSLPPAEQEAFKTEGGERTNDRASLLGRSNKLDNDDETLYWEGQRLNQRANDLNAEFARVNADVARFNQFCVGRSLPPGDLQYCRAERTRIENWKIDLGKRIDSHNVEFYAWEDKFPPFYAVANALGQAIQTWEGQIANLIDRLKQALAKIGLCQELERDFKNSCEKAKPCDETTGCPDIAANMKKNNACAKAADDLNQQCHGGSNQDLSARTEEARQASLACAARFKEKCDRWITPEDGLCLESRRKLLQREKDLACEKPYSCATVGYKKCTILEEFFINGTDCYNARKKIMDECFEKGDIDHKAEASMVYSVRAACMSRIETECRSSSIFDRR